MAGDIQGSTMHIGGIARLLLIRRMKPLESSPARPDRTLPPEG